MNISPKNAFKLLKLATNLRVAKKFLSLQSNGYLYSTGWFESRKRKVPVDKDGNPIPWYTYPFIDFIGERLKKTFDIFEYGCGNSTLYFSKRVNSVVAVEHDKEWFEKIRKELPLNAELAFKELDYGGEYSKAAVATGRQFDLVIIDGRDRRHCAVNCLGALKDGGVIIFDNSDRLKHQEAVEFLKKQGYRTLDFTGIAPGYFFKQCTSVFYKDNNCLGI